MSDIRKKENSWDGLERGIREGIINLNKPKGMTSHDCVNMLRRLTGVKRIGHTGTLDPNATGVLPLCIGTSARIAEYLDLDFKTYRCTMIPGLRTDTQDIWGTTETDRREELRQLQREGKGLTEEAVRRAFEPFGGIISQIPPKYSAIRVNGRRLYQYAREGQDVELKARTVYIKDLAVEEIDFEQMKITFSVECSKGTYIRSICRDAGDALGFGGCMCELERLSSGAFSIGNSVTIDMLRALCKDDEVVEQGGKLTFGRADVEAFNALLTGPEEALLHFGRFFVNEERAAWFVNGGHLALNEGRMDAWPEFKEKDFVLPIRDEYRRAYCIFAEKENKFLGVAFYDTSYKKLVADKVFAR
ncbi:MAG: tRNA pseudouridine(55) synthase TruB [Clostridia bacterium]|nr:tRNA pseudouridine(55) synthase TruB [Clostridia bacterium]